MALAIFDLDNTLLGGDSDHAWGEFLVDRQLVNPEQHRLQNDEFYRQYQEGDLDIHAYLCFALAPLKGKSPAELAPLHQQFMESYIADMILPKARDLIAQHQRAGDELMIITATNDFVTGPIAAVLGIPTLLASNAELRNGVYTGQPSGTPCFQEGKVTRLNSWLEEHNKSLKGSHFYSDSHNDLPLLKAVSRAVAVDPDDRLRNYAEQAEWEIISLR